jgi:hypothetical protein
MCSKTKFQSVKGQMMKWPDRVALGGKTSQFVIEIYCHLYK